MALKCMGVQCGEPRNTNTVDLLFNWFGISCMTTANFCFYLQDRLIQTSQTGGQQYSDTSPFSIPWENAHRMKKRTAKLHREIGHVNTPLDPVLFLFLCQS
jgi:hypothetical protein